MDLNVVRRRLEEGERQFSPYAARSYDSRGRERPEEPSPLRTEFQRDRDRIIHCKAFRRLKHKTQVFIAPVGDHFVTRLTHTLEVAQIARTIARALNLNEDLAEAIALGHDLGHPPFGHAGEQALAELLPEGFRHAEQSLRVVDKLERLHPKIRRQIYDKLQRLRDNPRPRYKIAASSSWVPGRQWRVPNHLRNRRR